MRTGGGGEGENRECCFSMSGMVTQSTNIHRICPKAQPWVLEGCGQAGRGRGWTLTQTLPLGSHMARPGCSSPVPQLSPSVGQGLPHPVPESGLTKQAAQGPSGRSWEASGSGATKASPGATVWSRGGRRTGVLGTRTADEACPARGPRGFPEASPGGMGGRVPPVEAEARHLAQKGWCGCGLRVGRKASSLPGQLQVSTRQAVVGRQPETYKAGIAAGVSSDTSSPPLTPVASGPHGCRAMGAAANTWFPGVLIQFQGRVKAGAEVPQRRPCFPQDPLVGSCGWGQHRDRALWLLA